MKDYLSAFSKRYLSAIRHLAIKPLIAKIDAIHIDVRSNQLAQVALTLQYKELAATKRRLPAFDSVQFRVFSGEGQDGILLYIFSIVGATNKMAVELCVGDVVGSNTANLIVNHGWNALLIDGNEGAIDINRRFYASRRDTSIWPPTMVHAWVTAENINQVIGNNGYSGEIDLLSLDIDGVDWWIWRAIDCISPRVVVVEYNDLWGPEKSVTVPYRPDFVAEWSVDGPDYAGASLPAFVKLGKEKGYRLIGCERYGFNAFFMRNDVGEELFPEVPALSCFWHPRTKWCSEKRLPRVAHKTWVEV